MDLKSLRTFQAIVKYGSFVRAAQEMNYVQSTVTMQIQKLEAELGVQLIERGKELTLTEAGRLFYEQSLQIVKSMEQLHMNLSDFKAGEAGYIRLGVTEPTASYRLPKILMQFLTIYPKMRISIDISNTPALCEKILKGDLDFALSTVPQVGSNLHYEPLFEEEFVALLPYNHPLANKKELLLEDLISHRILITSATCPYRKKLEMAMQEKGIVAVETMEIGSMTALKYYVQIGLGIAFVPKIAVVKDTNGVIVKNIAGSLVSMSFGIICKESAFPFQLASQKLYQYLRQELY